MDMKNLSPRFDYVGVFLIGVVSFMPFLGQTHLFDWDEINFAEAAREMLLTGNYGVVQINYEPFWEKPPLFFWLQALSMHLFGVNEWAARLPNALVGTASLLSIYSIGMALHGRRFAWFWVLSFWGSLTPHLYAKSGIIDPTFNLFIVLSISAICFHRYYVAGLTLGLAVLTKGPVAVLIVGLVLGILWLANRCRGILSWRGLGQLIASTLLVVGAWVLWEYQQHGSWFFEAFIEYQIRLFNTEDAGHGQPFYYHFVVVLLGCFPASILAIRYLFPAHKTSIRGAEAAFYHRLMLALFWVVMILFSVVRTKIVHYSSLAWFPVTYLSGWYLFQWHNGQISWSRWTNLGLIFIGFLLSAVLVGLPLVGHFAAQLEPYIHDRFAVANLQAQVGWQGWEWSFGVVLFLAIVLIIKYFPRQKILIFVIVAFVLEDYLYFVLPKVEGHTQRAAIDFFQSKKGKDVYIEPLGYKSYAQLFYFEKQPQKPRTVEWLLTSKELDKPAYFVTRLDRAEEWLKHPNLRKLGEKNGFIFFERIR
jgi:4-amino-4-deoxy-L-arabinose transferase-like glycosyltransferase